MREANENRTLIALSGARQIIEFLSLQPDALPALRARDVTTHVGAALADCTLQAGLRYDTVVSSRIRRILDLFPEAATVSGTIDVLSAYGPCHFLSWTHPRKIIRFTGLLCHVHSEGIESCSNLCEWLSEQNARQSLLSLPGIGPKTIDYLCGLVGLDCVAVDRHVRQLSRWAGIQQTKYSELKLMLSFAADLMNVPRREFDWWIWRMMSERDRLRDTR